MSDDFENGIEGEHDLDRDIFEIGEMILLTLKDGRHYLGQYIGLYDTGLAIKVEAKTSMKVVSQKDQRINEFIESNLEAHIERMATPADWFDMFGKLNPGMSMDYSLEELKEKVTEQIRAKLRLQAKSLWDISVDEQDVTKPYLRELKRSVRTLVMWDKINEVCSAVEMAEEAEIADLSNLIDNGEFFKLIEGDMNDD